MDERSVFMLCAENRKKTEKGLTSRLVCDIIKKEEFSRGIVMQKEETQILEVCRRFGLAGEYRSYEVLNSGHINSTYKVYFFRDGEMKDYVLQRVNTYVFKNPLHVMENIAQVTEYIRAKIKATGVTAKRSVLHYSTTDKGDYYTILDDGGFWRCCRYIDDSISFTQTDDLKIIEESGKAFGKFQTYLADFPVEKLHIVIPHFHNTIRRYSALMDAIENNFAGRAQEVQDVIDGYKEIEALAIKPYQLQRAGVLPLRVTHNDTKTSNVLFDEKTREYLTVIDLDTVMPGLVAFDFGDAIRVAASTVDEDEKDLSKVALDLEKYESFTRGFVGAIGDMISQAEKESLALGAIAMTAECGVRFLTDYLDGDKYFRIHYPDQNLARAKCHLALTQDMVRKLEKMQEIVKKY